MKLYFESDYSETDEFEEIKNIAYWVDGIKKLFIDDKEFNKKVSEYYYRNYNDRKEDKNFKKLEDALKYVHKAYLLLDDIDSSIVVNESLIREKISDKDYSNSVTGKAYKVFKVKNGKLYPPMVSNPGGADTPVGVWLDAEPGEFIEIDGLKRVVQSGRNRDKLMQRVANLDNLDPEERKAEVKKLKSSTLAYRPGWHLGDIPRASQFDSSLSWEEIEYDGAPDKEFNSLDSFIGGFVKKANIGKVAYIRDTDSYYEVISNGEYFPYDFVWAECDYIADIDYQDEAMSYGYKKGKKFQHSLAGLPRVPEGGSYKYRTNPRPDTVPWVITGAIKVTKLLGDDEVKRICAQNGVTAPERQGGNKTLRELGF